VRFETAPHARIYGAEFDLLCQVAPNLVPGLVATANGAWLHAQYTDYPAASGFTDDGIPFGGGGLIIDGGVLPGRDFKGNRIVRTPKFSGTAGLSYTGNAPGGSFEVAADVYYNSGFYYTAQNIATAEEGAYELVDARVSYLYESCDLRLTLFGQNLGDQLHALNKLPTDIGTWTTYAPPRTYGVRLAWSF
jgi:iron complex outermembrane receptor protein